MAEQHHHHDHAHCHHHHHQHDHSHSHHHGHEMMGQDHFDSEQVALAWTTDPLVVFLNETLHQVLLERFGQYMDPSSTTVLDFGCGTGLLTKSLVGKVHSVVGVDVSPAMIQVYNQHAYPTAKGVCLDLVKEGLLEDKFDFIISCYALHHVSDPAHRVSVLASYLKPGGRLLFGEFEAHESTPKEFFPRGQLGEWMKRAGLEHVEEQVAFERRPEELPESPMAKKGDMFTRVIIAQGTKPL